VLAGDATTISSDRAKPQQKLRSFDIRDGAKVRHASVVKQDQSQISVAAGTSGKIVTELAD
jgi:hypothetical protein